MRRTLIAAAAVVASATALAADFPPLQRVPVLDQPLPATTIGHLKGVRIAFAPGQPTRLHMHPAATVGVVTRGSFVFQPHGRPKRILKTGDAFYEPAGARIDLFDNASKTQGAEIEAFYLLERADQPLITMLQPGA